MCDYRRSREEWEWANLAPYAGHSLDPRLTWRISSPSQSAPTAGTPPFRREPELLGREEVDSAGSLSRFKTAFQIDKERITASTAFRRLEYKTQVFVSHEGDHFRTRLTHTLEVDETARFIAQALRLNEDLVEAIALGHDLGHTPFGHAGEHALCDLMREAWPGDKSCDLPTERMYGGAFYHNVQSVRVVDTLEKGYEWDRRPPIRPNEIGSPETPKFGRQRGLDLTWAVREGILKHSSRGLKARQSLPRMWGSRYLMEELRYDVPATLEGQVVEFADEIASLMHDLEDGYRSRLFEVEELLSGLLEIVTESRLPVLLGIADDDGRVPPQKHARYRKLADIRSDIERFYRGHHGGDRLSAGNVFGFIRTLLISNIVESTHRSIVKSLGGPVSRQDLLAKKPGGDYVWVRIHFENQQKYPDEWYTRAWQLDPTKCCMRATTYRIDPGTGETSEGNTADVGRIIWMPKSETPDDSQVVVLIMQDGRRIRYPLRAVCVGFENAQIVGYSQELLEFRDWLRTCFIPTHLHESSTVLRMNDKGRRFLRRLFELYLENPQLMSKTALERFDMWKDATDEKKRMQLRQKKAFVLRIAEHLQGMTDRYLNEEYHRLFTAGSSVVQQVERSISDPLALRTSQAD